jgi:hypothetical protein
MSISLPKQPTGYQFEEAVAANIRSIGYFTENRTVLDHEGREVLELDVVASPASADFTKKILVDAKKDTAGFSDIFKIYGWRTFLKIPKGCIVHGTAMDAPALGALKEVCPKLEVFANHLDVAAPTLFEAIPVINAGADEQLRRIVASVGWYQLIADRLTVEDFHKVRKLTPDDPLFDRVRQYRRACHLAFFESDPLRRAELLYNAFKKDPGISGACVEWQAAKDGKTPDAIWELVRDSAAFPWIQHVMALETRARILIIKNGLEAALNTEPAGDMMAEFWKDLKLSMLPDNFREGFDRASVHAHRTAIPYILQTYTETFGGFLVDDMDRLQLASLAGVPVETVGEAFEIFDTFYPTSKGWHTASKELRMMKMIPAYLRGIGAFTRQSSRNLKAYGTIAPNMHWLVSKWHNAAYAILERELAVKPVTK